MPLQIFNNISSLTTRRLLGASVNRLGSSISKVASGIRVQKSSDDGASLAISTRLRSDTRALQQASRNANDGQNMIATTEGGLNEIARILIRLREITSQSATATIGDSERQSLQLEFSQLRHEIDRIANSSEYNGQKLLNGELAATSTDPVSLQIGLDSSKDSRFNLSEELDIGPVTTGKLGLTGASVSTRAGALVSMGILSAAVDKVSSIRAKTAAVQMRLSHAIASLNVTVENLIRADSTVRDADFGQELTKLTKDSILVQSGAAMVVQANLVPQNVLVLLNGL